jgi:ribulose-phosphate 3-epimerase
VPSLKHPHRLIQKIKESGIKPAIALNPHSRVEDLEHLLPDLDMVLIMSVNPGFGGQSFIESALPKIAKLRKMIDDKNLKTLIEVDGGVSNKNIELLRDAGVDIVVSGSYIFKQKDLKEAINSLR